jgi:protein TonB
MKPGLLKLLLICTALLAACGAPTTDTIKPGSATETPKTPEKLVNKPEQKILAKSNAKTNVEYQHELALHLSRVNAPKIYTTNPQALLRSVVVLRFTLNAQGNLLSKAIVRSNKDKETEATALSSLVSAQPFPIPPPLLLKQGKLDMVETWLFNKDGRFQLRTIALPQANQ